MFFWAVTFLVIAIIALALWVFGALIGAAAWIAKVVFVLFAILFVVSLISGRGGKKPLA